MGAPFYGFLSNRYTSALVSPQGVVEWLPWPRFDGDAVFCRLLDHANGGYLSTMPEAPLTAHQQWYRPGTLLLETRLQTEGGEARLTDFLPIGRSSYWRRIESDIPLVLICRPTFGYGYASAAYRLTDNGALFYHPSGMEGIALHIRGPAQKLASRDAWRVGPGSVDVLLRYASDYAQETDYLARPMEEGARVEGATERYWRDMRPVYDGPWADWFHRSLLTIRALTYRNNGAMLAAATTSLPEVVGESRQWDYRYVWVRDGAYGAEALLLAGDPVGCRQFLEFIFNVIDLVGKPYPSPLVRVDGTIANAERELLWLSGHQGSRPVRVGNAASQQVQLDIEGELLWVLWMYWRMTGDRTFVRDYWWAVESLVEWLIDHWDQPDASLWEFRGLTDYFTHSQVLCWAGVVAGEALAREVLNDHQTAARWQGSQRAMRRAILRRQEATGLGRFTQAPGQVHVDAALLMLPLYGFVDVEHPAFLRTLEAVEQQLVRQGTVLRYRADNLGETHHPFTLAGFWLARIYLRLGDFARADAVIARQCELATDLQLFSEHADPDTGACRGNFPQLFPHAGLVTTLVERQRLMQGDPLWVPWHSPHRT